MNSPNSVRQSGQASIEYAVVCAALAFALGVGMVDNNSVLWQLIEAFKLAYQKYSYSLSLPL
ncbi:hypothetical protein [Paraherbaspirillum soli]|uniref:Flp family type IVb pilin n=1 Tax=Paraherbaspirillum soli TaxID=631222 RepID=A0ABW0MDE5_9BURK